MLLGGVAFRNLLCKIHNMGRQCVRCWVHLRDGEKLWCRVCIDRVNEELEWKADREWRYYFRWHLRHKK